MTEDYNPINEPAEGNFRSVWDATDPLTESELRALIARQREAYTIRQEQRAAAVEAYLNGSDEGEEE